MEWFLKVGLPVLGGLAAIVTILGTFAGIFIYIQRSELSKKFEEYGFSKLKNDVNNLVIHVGHVLKALVKIGVVTKDSEYFFERAFEHRSPKRITKIGRDILEESNIKEFISKCDLSVKDLKTFEDIKVYIACMNWVKEHAKEKVIEFTYKYDLSKEDSEILLALALQERFLFDKKVRDIATEEELQDIISNKEWQSYKIPLKCCDIDFSNYVYEAINKLDYYIGRFGRIIDKIYVKDGELRDRADLIGKTFNEVLNKSDYDLLVKFFTNQIAEDTLVIEFRHKKAGMFKIQMVVDILQGCKNYIRGKVIEYKKKQQA